MNCMNDIRMKDRWAENVSKYAKKNKAAQGSHTNLYCNATTTIPGRPKERKTLHSCMSRTITSTASSL